MVVPSLDGCTVCAEAEQRSPVFSMWLLSGGQQLFVCEYDHACKIIAVCDTLMLLQLHVLQFPSCCTCFVEHFQRCSNDMLGTVEKI